MILTIFHSMYILWNIVKKPLSNEFGSESEFKRKGQYRMALFLPSSPVWSKSNLETDFFSAPTASEIACMSFWVDDSPDSL